MRRILIIPTAAVLLTMAMAGCTAGSGTSSDSPGVVNEQAPQVSRDGGESSGSDAAGGGDSIVTESTVDSGRQVIVTGFVTITVEKPVDAASDAVRIVEQSGGRVDGRSEIAPVNGSDGSATLTLRVPSDTLTATLDKLRELGAVQEVSLNSADVTMETQDLDARITAMSASVDRLLGLLATATDTENLITLETAISDRQAQLESMQSQRRYLADQVSLSTITLNLVSDFTAPTPEPDNFFDGISAGWAAFVGFFAGLLVVFGVLLPWIVFLGLIALVVIVILRRRSTSAATSAVARATEPTTETTAVD
ncbi:hypothetical protein IWX81_002536 [Salinibacterium sp. CAN_S4]|uniref:DUF4349 domain-containing protein n=1 Tax=Salinibacterium sp. CAN_S4 TaxID=2787727 RepID=UPI0018EFE15D